MNESPDRLASRRSFLKSTGTIAAASTFAGWALPHVHAAENNTIRIALVGCGGRGTGAVANALTAKGGPAKLVAMADVFDDRLAGSYDGLKPQFGHQIDVPDDRKFVGFDGYRKAIDCLAPGDVVIFATPPAFRWVNFTYAIEKGINVFMEKPVTVDGPSTRRMLKLAEDADKKNLKVGVGLMWRHCKARQALLDRVKSGEIGDIITLRAYRMHGPIGSFLSEPKPEGASDLLYQIRQFHSFLWASGGCYNDFYIHNIDECCWMKGAWPVEAQATGGRHYRGDYVDQNFDNYSVEYTFDDGTKMFLYGRCIGGCHDQFGSYMHGSKRQAVISINAGMPSHSAIYRQQKLGSSQLVWKFTDPEPNPYEVEWEDLYTAIRQDKPYNEVKRGAEASLVSSMGRMAAHTGQVITFDQMLNLEHEFAPDLDKLALDSPSPLMPGPDGKYPVPQPGLVNDREY
ncbi:MAG: Gfo/Idh/MocA family oxidoreductase [Pirellulaceae bacterium]